jgi:hypothetical protein
MKFLLPAFLLALSITAAFANSAVTVNPAGTVVNTGPVNFNLATTQFQLNGVTPSTSAAAALGNATNGASGLPVLDSNGNVPLFHEYSNPMPVYEPTGTVSGSLTPTLFNVVGLGDSIMGGGGALNSANSYYQASAPLLSSSGWFFGLPTQGFCLANGTTFNLGYGGETTEQGTAHLYNSQGQTASISIANGSSTGTFTATPQWIINNAIVTGTGIGANTTMSFGSATTTASLTPLTSTIAVTGTAGITAGMWVSALSYGQNSASVALPANATVSSVPTSTSIVLSSPLPSGNNVGGVTLFFFSPTATLTNAYTGTTGTITVNSGGTALTGTAVFTSGSKTCSITGTVVGLVPSSLWFFPMGSMNTPSGDYFTGITGNGSGTGTLAVAASKTGTVTFVASATIHDVAAINTYGINGINATAYTLAPNNTGVPGYVLDNYGINNSGAGTGTATFATDYATQIADLVAMGYQVVYITIPPPAANNSIGETYTLVNGYNAWLKTANLPNASLCDILPLFPTGNPNFPEWTHSPITNDGVHPSNPTHAAMAGYVNDFLLGKFGGSSVVLTYPNGGANLNSQWLPNSVAQTNLPNIFGAIPVNGGTAGVANPQTIVGSLNLQGVFSSGSTLNLFSNSGAAPSNLVFGQNSFGSITPWWTVEGSPNGFIIADSQTGRTLLAFANLSNDNIALGGASNSTFTYAGQSFYIRPDFPACGFDNSDDFRGFVQIGSALATSGARVYRLVSDNGTGFELRAYNNALNSFTQLASFTGNSTSTGSLVLAGGLSVAGTITGNILTVQTGTLIGGSSTKTVPAGSHPWVQDTAATLTNVGVLTVTVSGTTATITSVNPLDTSTYTLFNAGSQ